MESGGGGSGIPDDDFLGGGITRRDDAGVGPANRELLPAKGTLWISAKGKNKKGRLNV